nr:hypothetical protein [Pandoravirus belohorizontensis]
MNASNNNNATSADAFVAALLQQQQQQPAMAGRGRTQQAAFPLGGAASATNGLQGSGVVQARQTAGRGRAASQLVQQRQQSQGQQALAIGAQQNGALGGSLGLAQPAAGRGRTATARTRATRQQNLPVGAPAIPLAQQFALDNGAALTQGTDRQALSALFGTAPTNGTVSQQQTPPRRARTSAAATANNGNALLGLANGQQQVAPRRARSNNAASALAGSNNNAFAATNNANNAAGFGLGGAASFDGQFQNQGQNQAASRRARSASANTTTNNNNALGHGASNPFGAQGSNNGEGGANSNASDKNKYILVDAMGNRLGSEYRSKSAYGAAGKAAARGHTDIYLWDRNHPVSEGGRVYSYAGRVEPITNPTAHTQKYGFTKKPVVQSRGYVDLDSNFRPIQGQQASRGAF